MASPRRRSPRRPTRTSCAKSVANGSPKKVGFGTGSILEPPLTHLPFLLAGNLKTHIRSVHTKEKPFACPICGKCFSQKGNMQTHVRTHNKDDRFPCNLCGKTFSQKGTKG